MRQDGCEGRGVPAPTAGRPGFTIVEIILAMVLLSFVVLGFQAATGQIIHYSAQSDRQLVAVQLVEDRLATIRLDPDYAELKARYELVESQISGFPSLSRATSISRVSQIETTGVLDYHRVTVTVSGAGLREPVARTVVVAAP